MSRRSIEVLSSAMDRRPAIDALLKSTTQEDLARWSVSVGKILELQGDVSANDSQFSEVESQLVDLIQKIPLCKLSSHKREGRAGFGFNPESLLGSTEIVPGAAGALRESEASQAERDGIPPHNSMPEFWELIQQYLEERNAK